MKGEISFGAAETFYNSLDNRQKIALFVSAAGFVLIIVAVIIW